MTVNKELEWGRLKAKLIGTWSTNNGNDILGSPYELALWFTPDFHDYNQIEIYKIKFIDIKNRKIVYENSKRLIQRINNHDKSFFFMYEKLKIPYSDYDLTIKYILFNQNKKLYKNMETHVQLKRKYEQNKKLRFWSRLMSV